MSILQKYVAIPQGSSPRVSDTIQSLLISLITHFPAHQVKLSAMMASILSKTSDQSCSLLSSKESFLYFIADSKQNKINCQVAYLYLKDLESYTCFSPVEKHTIATYFFHYCQGSKQKNYSYYRLIQSLTSELCSTDSQAKLQAKLMFDYSRVKLVDNPSGVGETLLSSILPLVFKNNTTTLLYDLLFDSDRLQIRDCIENRLYAGDINRVRELLPQWVKRSPHSLRIFSQWVSQLSQVPVSETSIYSEARFFSTQKGAFLRLVRDISETYDVSIPDLDSDSDSDASCNGALSSSSSNKKRAHDVDEQLTSFHRILALFKDIQFQKGRLDGSAFQRAALDDRLPPMMTNYFNGLYFLAGNQPEHAMKYLKKTQASLKHDGVLGEEMKPFVLKALHEATVLSSLAESLWTQYCSDTTYRFSLGLLKVYTRLMSLTLHYELQGNAYLLLGDFEQANVNFRAHNALDPRLDEAQLETATQEFMLDKALDNMDRDRVSPLIIHTYITHLEDLFSAHPKWAEWKRTHADFYTVVHQHFSPPVSEPALDFSIPVMDNVLDELSTLFPIESMDDTTAGIILDLFSDYHEDKLAACSYYTFLKAIYQRALGVSQPVQSVPLDRYHKQAPILDISSFTDSSGQLLDTAYHSAHRFPAVDGVGCWDHTRKAYNPNILFAHQAHLMDRALQSEDGFICAHDMGLGKTLFGIQLIKQHMQSGRTSLVLAPVSVLHQWREEIKRFCPALKVLVYPDDRIHRQAYDVVICSYEKYAIDCKVLDAESLAKPLMTFFAEDISDSVEIAASRILQELLDSQRYDATAKSLNEPVDRPLCKALVDRHFPSDGTSQFETIRQNVSEKLFRLFKKAHLSSLSPLRSMDWRIVVLDEIQKLNNHDSSITGLVRALPITTKRYGLSGTPANDTILGLREAITLVQPDRASELGDVPSFQAQYNRVIDPHGHSGLSRYFEQLLAQLNPPDPCVSEVRKALYEDKGTAQLMADLNKAYAPLCEVVNRTVHRCSIQNEQILRNMKGDEGVALDSVNRVHKYTLKPDTVMLLRYLFSKNKELINQTLMGGDQLLIKRRRYTVTFNDLWAAMGDLHHLTLGTISYYLRCISKEKQTSSKEYNVADVKRILTELRDNYSSPSSEVFKTGKVAAITKDVRTCLDSGNAVVIGYYHRSMGDALASELGPEHCYNLNGSVSPHHRPLMADQFNHKLSVRERCPLSWENDAFKACYHHYFNKDNFFVGSDIKAASSALSTLAHKKEQSWLQSFFERFGKPVFLLQLKAGGVGINLQERAHHFFFAEEWWNKSIMEQAVGRIYRYGQKETVEIHSYRTSSTSIEQRQELIQMRKKACMELAYGNPDLFMEWAYEVACTRYKNDDLFKPQDSEADSSAMMVETPAVQVTASQSPPSDSLSGAVAALNETTNGHVTMPEAQLLGGGGGGGMAMPLSWVGDPMDTTPVVGFNGLEDYNDDDWGDLLN